MGTPKTNAMRILEKEKISYQMHTYDASDGQIDGAAVARKVGMDPAKVFKTLVTQGHSGNYFVCVLPVEHELNLKKAAKVFGEKSLEMIPVAKINAVTGYIRGGDVYKRQARHSSRKRWWSAGERLVFRLKPSPTTCSKPAAVSMRRFWQSNRRCTTEGGNGWKRFADWARNP